MLQMWKMELHFVPVKGDREDKNFKEKKKQEDNKKKRGQAKVQGTHLDIGLIIHQLYGRREDQLP